MKTEATVQ